MAAQERAAGECGRRSARKKQLRGGSGPGDPRADPGGGLLPEQLPSLLQVNLALVQCLLGLLQAGHGCPRPGQVALDERGLLHDRSRVLLELSLPPR